MGRRSTRGSEAQCTRRAGPGLGEGRDADLMRARQPVVAPLGAFADISRKLLGWGEQHLRGRDTGVSWAVVSLHDIKTFSANRNLAELVISRDICGRIFPPWRPITVDDALGASSASSPSGCRRGSRRSLRGSLAKSDLCLRWSRSEKKPPRRPERLALQLHVSTAREVSTARGR